jgi:FkbM family methyltransferase
MTRSSGLLYTAWRALPATEAITIRLTNGVRVTLRRPPAEDILLFREIFLEQVYRISELDSCKADVRRILDIGSNIGYSVLWFAAQFPGAKISAFEPVADHIDLLTKAIAANRLNDRVIIYPAAVGTENRNAYMVTAGLRSRLTPETGPNRVRTAVVDFFESVGAGHIDILKLDCEGSEYELLMDKRFADLNVRALLLEWHAYKNRPRADIEIAARLRSLGWRIRRSVEGSVPEDPDTRIGMMHASRQVGERISCRAGP